MAREWRWTLRSARELVRGLVIVDPATGCEEEITSANAGADGRITLTVQQLGVQYLAGYVVAPDTVFRTRSK
jgi:hypothetical protein